MSISCVITGCGLLDPTHPRFAWGDLWESGDSWIINAVCDERGETRWDYEPKPHSQLNYVEVIDKRAPFFERRGVLIVPKYWCKLSPAAVAYLVRARGIA